MVTTHYYLGGRQVAMREDSTLIYLHQDHLSGTALVTNDSGTQAGTTMKYYPYGATRSGSVMTDKQFTGQRLDGTGLYYYNARYYDPVIGRFISVDSTITDPINPQALNRYSYCINDPLKHVDPSGRDYVVVGGNLSTPAQAVVWRKLIREDLSVDSGEKIIFLPDNNGWGVATRVGQLVGNLNNRNLTDIKIIGFGEGASTVAAFTDAIADDPGLLKPDVQEELTSIIMLDRVSGISGAVMAGDDAEDMANLPRRLVEHKVFSEVTIADIWDKGSPSHMSGVHPGWEEDVNAFGYGSGGGLLAAIISGGVIGSFGGPFGTLAGGFIAGLAYGLLEHTAMWKDPAVWDIIEGVIPD